MTGAAWAFDRHLRYDELRIWLEGVAAAHPALVSLDVYGTSSEGRELLLVTITDTDEGDHDSKPAHWVDANIHATELTACIAACHLIDRLVSGHAAGDERVVEALRTRTFYVVPRVNPDGAELALADQPRHLRSSTRPWPRTAGDPLPGLLANDIDGDGRILQMRIADPSGGWMSHPDDARLMVPIPLDGVPAGTNTYRLLTEGSVVDHDGFTIPTPRAPEGLDLNRNYPAGWDSAATGAGDHPLSEPEVLSLVQAITERPNICGSHALHTHGGVLLRPSSTTPDAELPPFDVWAWTELGARATELTGYPVHSVYEEFTWDRSDMISGAADDWAYEHNGIFGWTTEFWDAIEKATGTKRSTSFWWTGPTDAEALAVLRWVEEVWPDGFVAWRSFDHPQLGPVELGGFDRHNVWNNPPPPLLAEEVQGHADAVIVQALASPLLEIEHVACLPLGTAPLGTASDLPTWRLEVGVSNRGWLPTDVSARARKNKLVLGGDVTIAGDGVEVVGGPARQEFGQLDGRAQLRFRGGNDGTPDRALLSWVIRAAPGTRVNVRAGHPRAGTAQMVHEIG